MLTFRLHTSNDVIHSTKASTWAARQKSITAQFKSTSRNCHKNKCNRLQRRLASQFWWNICEIKATVWELNNTQHTGTHYPSRSYKSLQQGGASQEQRYSWRYWERGERDAKDKLKGESQKKGHWAIKSQSQGSYTHTHIYSPQYHCRQKQSFPAGEPFRQGHSRAKKNMLEAVTWKGCSQSSAFWTKTFST